MQILLISGSQRNHSKSAEVAKLIQRNLLDQQGSVSSEVVSSEILELSAYPSLLAHYGSDAENNNDLAKDKDEVLAKLYACDAVVFIAPEWGGMIPPALVNLLLLTANGSANGLPLGHKPAFAVGVSASGGGSNAISLLKSYAAKNSHLVWLPLHAIITNVDSFLTHQWQPECHSDDRIAQLQSRLAVGINSLFVYAKQLSPVREELVALSKVHPFGQ
ncbi:MAG: NAD(P)H-dependent oxidoreductase [Colwellia sp.]|nr:NAD(P)H-dependent oxidoreductase [Colwellia sp.]